MENEKVNIHVDNIVDGITILYGKAPEQKRVVPEIVDINGNINAPAEFFVKRKQLHVLENSHILYSINRGFIELVLDEEDPYRVTVTGKLHVNPELEALHINDFNACYDRHELIKLLKLKRYLFVSASVHQAIIDQLRNLSATLQTIIESTNDQKGNKKDLIEKKLDHQLKLDFVLKMPLYVGYQDAEFSVTVIVDYAGGETLTFYLESLDLVDKMDAMKKGIFAENLAVFDEIVKIEQA